MVPSKQQRSHGKRQTNNEFIMYQQPPSIDYMRSLPSLSTVVQDDKVENNMIQQQQMIHPEHSFPSTTSSTNTTNSTSAVTPIPTQRTYVYSNDPNNDENHNGRLNAVPAAGDQQNLYNNQHDMIHNSNDIVGPPSLQQQQVLQQHQNISKNNGDSQQHMTVPTPVTMDSSSLRYYQRMEMFPPSSSTHTFYSSQPLQTTSSANNHVSQHNLSAQQQQQQQLDDHNKVYSFMPLESVFQQKRPRRKFNEIDRLYKCNYHNCTKAYGTLNHLNAHISMQEHGPKRLPVEFKELRKQLRKSKAEITARNRNSIASTSSAEQQQKQQRRTSSIDYQHPTPDANTRFLSNNEFNSRKVVENDNIHGSFSGTTNSNFLNNGNGYHSSSASVSSVATPAPPPVINNHTNYQYRSFQPQPEHAPITTNSQQQAYQRQLHIMQQQQQFH